MFEKIKFVGKEKNEGVKKAIAFFYDNLDKEATLEEFLAKCRYSATEKTVYFYPNMKVDLEEFRKHKRERKSKKDES